MAVLSPHPLIIALNVNGLNSPIKRQTVAGWIKKQDPSTCCLQETHISSKDKHRLKVKDRKMILQANDSQKEADVISVCIHQTRHTLSPKKVARDKDEHYIMIKGNIHQEDITVANMYVSIRGGGSGKEPRCQETQVRYLGREDPREEGMATHFSILAWRIPWIEEPGGLYSQWSRKSHKRLIN